MSCGEGGVVGSEDVVGGPWIVGSWAFAAEVAVSGGLPYESGSFWVVALVVGSGGVADGLAFAFAGWAAGGCGGEGAAFDAGSANRHVLNGS